MQTITLDNGIDRALLPRLTFGAGELTDIAKKEEYFALLDDFYFQFGGRCFDTARSYGNGMSEKILGLWLRDRKIDRSAVFISTKGGFAPPDDRHGCRLDRESLTSDINASLAASGLEYFDLYLLHRDHPSMSAADIMHTLNEFVIQKKTRFIGVSNWKTDRIDEANRIAAEQRLIPLSVSQVNFSLAQTTPALLEDDTLVAMNEQEYHWYREHRFAVMAFSAQAKGFFAKLAAGDSPTPKIRSRFLTEENLCRLERVKQLSRELRVSPGALALAYLTCNPLDVSAVFRCRTRQQLADTMSAQNITLTPEQINWLTDGKTY